MDIEFDPAKDIAKHGVSLAMAANFPLDAVVVDSRYAEPRFRAYAIIEGLAYCLAFTIRDDVMRVISLRRTHMKEFNRHA